MHRLEIGNTPQLRYINWFKCFQWMHRLEIGNTPQLRYINWFKCFQ